MTIDDDDEGSIDHLSPIDHLLWMFQRHPRDSGIQYRC